MKLSEPSVTTLYNPSANKVYTQSFKCRETE